MLDARPLQPQRAAAHELFSLHLRPKTSEYAVATLRSAELAKEQ